MAMDTQVAQQFLDENFAPWVLALKPRVTQISNDGAHLQIPITPDIARAGNIVSGQTLATLADTAMVIACGAVNGEMLPVGTVTLDTQFLRPASGETITAKATVTRMGRSMAFARADLFTSPGDKIVATATATFAK
jgi:uncharacterized protein (TIGR00369 family)